AMPNTQNAGDSNAWASVKLVSPAGGQSTGRCCSFPAADGRSNSQARGPKAITTQPIPAHSSRQVGSHVSMTNLTSANPAMKPTAVKNEYTPMIMPDRLPVERPTSVMLTTERALCPKPRVSRTSRNRSIATEAVQLGPRSVHHARGDDQVTIQS